METGLSVVRTVFHKARTSSRITIARLLRTIQDLIGILRTMQCLKCDNGQAAQKMEPSNHQQFSDKGKKKIRNI